MENLSKERTETVPKDVEEHVTVGVINDIQENDQEDVTNEEMEAVILENPNIFPMRVALANRYFDEVDYSNALPHYMYVAENSDESEIKSFALAQIAWMVFESGNTKVATNYLNESLNRLANGSVNTDKLLITKALRGYYKNPDQIAHQVLAKRIGKRDPGNKPRPGDRIPYVYILTNKNTI